MLDSIGYYISVRDGSIQNENFYFDREGENRFAKEYWDVYDKNHKEAREKYIGHMYCPVCKSAPLSVANGYQRRYLKVTASDMEKHSIGCGYRYDEATKKEIHDFYKDLDKTDIKSRLVSCLNRMLKKSVKSSSNGESSKTEGNENREDFLVIKSASGVKKCLPHKNFNLGDLDEEMDVQKIYYGRCFLYIYKYIPENENDVKVYYLKVLDRKKRQVSE